MSLILSLLSDFCEKGEKIMNTATNSREKDLEMLTNQWVSSQKAKMADLAVALIAYKDAIVADYAKFSENLEYVRDKFGIEFDVGSKYVKIVAISAGGSRSVHSFVEKSTGDIWKAASWKAPARNFTRGNVYITSSYEKRVRWTGIC